LSTPYLSIIIPAYNEEHRLPTTLEQAFAFFEAQSYLIEVLVVENGSQDQTLRIAQEFASRHPHFYALHESGRGKGLAVRRGMLEAQGDYLFMCDADLSMPLDEINRFLPPALEGGDLVIGSREAPGSVRYNEPQYRHLGGRLINMMIRMLALPGLHDTQCGFKCFRRATQCGFKCFRRAVAEDLFKYQTLTGWSFDIELLYIARLRGYQILELPIPWYFNPESKLNLVQDALQMGLDIFTIKRNARQGLYDR